MNGVLGLALSHVGSISVLFGQTVRETVRRRPEWPVVLAIAIMLPVLVVFADFVGIMGGLIMAVFTLHQPAAFYMQHVVQALSVQDVLSGVGKSIFFALFISLIACHSGLSAEGGAD